MSHYYSDPRRESDPHALPDIEIFEMTPQEAATFDEDLIYEYMRRSEFRLANMNTKTRIAMIDTVVADHDIRGGWFWWACFPGCLPDGPPTGPFDSHAEALADAQENA